MLVAALVGATQLKNQQQTVNHTANATGANLFADLQATRSKGQDIDRQGGKRTVMLQYCVRRI